MNKTVKNLVLLLAMILMLSTITAGFSACNNNQTDGTEPGGNTESDTTTTETKENVDYKAFLPKATYDGAEVGVILSEAYNSHVFVDDEASEDAFDQAVYKRNSYIEETYDIYFDFIPYPGAPSYAHDLCRAELYTETGDFEIVLGDYYWGLEVSGYFKNLTDLDQVNLENPYWVNGWNDQATVNGKLFAASGFYTMFPISLTEAVFVNNYVGDDFDISTDDFYELVQSGNWTMEKMLEFMELATVENGDGQLNFDDKYGMSYNLWSGRALLWGAGLSMASINADTGMPNFTLTTEQNINVFQMVYKFLNDNAYSYYGGGAGSAERGDNDMYLFCAGRSLFELAQIGQAARVAQELDSFSILPMPKYDSNQADYISSLLGTNLLGIMNTSKNMERSANILEAMTIISYTDVRPVYYEDLLKVHYQTDPRTAEMIDFIVDRLSIDFLFVHTYSFGGAVDVPFDLILSYNRNYKSSMTKHEDEIETNWANVVDYYTKTEATS